MRNTLRTGELVHNSALPLDTDELQALEDEAGNGLTDSADSVTRKDYAQVQQNYELVKETRQALDIIMKEFSPFEDINDRDVASRNQLKVVGTMLHPAALTQTAKTR
jgi:hypothetical protein